MRKVKVRKIDGVIDNIIVINPADIPVFPDHDLIDDDGTAEIGGTWNGSQFLSKPPIDPAIVDALKNTKTAVLLGRAVDKTFLNGFWLVFKAIAPIGVPAIDDAVSANDRVAFDAFFFEQVKSNL